MFKSDNNRRYFLKKYAEYLSGFVKTYAYCLMSNHFHLLVQIGNENEILKVIKETPIGKRTILQQQVLQQNSETVDFSLLIHKQFHRWFTAYSMAFNKQQNRKGNLFNRLFKRVAVQNDAHFTQLIYYIQANPKRHKICDDFTQYKWNSYQSILSDKPTLLEIADVIKWFETKLEFIQYHLIQSDLEDITYLIIEDS